VNRGIIEGAAMKQWVRSSLARSLPVLATPLLALGALATMTPASVASASVAAGARPAAPAAPVVPASLRTAIHKSLGPAGYSRQTRLSAADGARGDEFGYSVALSGSGTTALVGAWERHTSAGAAYVFRLRNGRWSQTAELTAPHGAAYDEFGYSVALSGPGTTAVVGDLRRAGTGAAYVFRLRGGHWSQSAVLTAANGAGGDSFGGAVAVSAPGATIVVGAFGANLTPGLAAGTGAAYVFRLRGRSWRQTAELTPAHGAPLDVFGGSVSVSAAGTTALVGAAGHNTNQGAAYVFRSRGRTWSQTELTAPHPAAGDDFGISVSLSALGSTALVGATGRSGETGAAFVYRLRGHTWSRTAQLTAGDGAVREQFGYSVALSADGTTALGGAPYHNEAVGAAYVFRLRGHTWSQTAELTAAHAAYPDLLGGSVSLSASGNTALAGAIGRNSYAGAAFVFTGRGRP
jgi:hypothetical protein